MQLACRWILLVCKAGSSKVAQDEILSMVGPTKNVFLAAIMGSEMNRILVDISLKLYAFVFLLSLADCFSVIPLQNGTGVRKDWTMLAV
jgi:hypothetical protein